MLLPCCSVYDYIFASHFLGITTFLSFWPPAAVHLAGLFFSLFPQLPFKEKLPNFLVSTICIDGAFPQSSIRHIPLAAIASTAHSSRVLFIIHGQQARHQMCKYGTVLLPTSCPGWALTALSLHFFFFFCHIFFKMFIPGSSYLHTKQSLIYIGRNFPNIFLFLLFKISFHSFVF